MRTLSARILLGFAALTVTFGVITATVVFNMKKVEDQIHLVGVGFVPLALDSKGLAGRQQDLKSYLDDGFQSETNLKTVRTHLNIARETRNRSLNNFHKTFERL